MNILKNLVLFIWMMPQDVVGLFLVFVVKRMRCTFIGNGQGMPVCVVRTTSFGGGISLGHFVLMDKYSGVDVLSHELGHTVQSMILGPLYLFVIGIPSISWCGLRVLGLFRKRSYYWFYTESWADRIAGIKR